MVEKLKSDALDTYGEGFENNKSYKKALLNLNNEYAKNMKDAWKEDFKENHKVLSGIGESFKEGFDEIVGGFKNLKESLWGVLGPVGMILKPFAGVFGSIFKGIKGGVKWLFGKFSKKNPTASDVLKSGAMGVGALYIGNKLEQMFGKTQGEDKSLLDNIGRSL